MIWLIGNKGMLGAELSLLLEKQGIPFAGTDREVDIASEEALSAFARGAGTAWIINCAAYTAVDKAEDDSEICRRLNTDGAANVAKAAQGIGAKLIHISTDYVFNGKGSRPYREDDPTGPIGVYGLSKRDGEVAVLGHNPRSFIVRTAWLYGRHGNNFPATMLRLMNERDAVTVVNDQRGSPTWAHDLASLIIEVIRAARGGREIPYGVYHYANEGAITWYDFALEIYNQGRALGLIGRDCAVRPCASAEFPAKVARPAYSVLDKAKIKAALGIEIPPWDVSLGEYLRSLVRI